LRGDESVGGCKFFVEGVSQDTTRADEKGYEDSLALPWAQDTTLADRNQESSDRRDEHHCAHPVHSFQSGDNGWRLTRHF
jgi:hypothetical protein